MATVTGLTAARMKAIEAASVVGGSVVNERLILTKQDTTTIDAGNVRGPAGPVGPAGDVSNIGLRRGLFSVYRGAALTVPAGAHTPIPMDVEDFDLSGWHGSAGFNPQLAGYYRLSVAIFIGTTVPNNTRLILSMFRNGGSWKSLNTVYTAGGDNNQLTGSVIVRANGTTDTFQPGLHQNSNGPTAVQSGSTFFQGELIAPTV